VSKPDTSTSGGGDSSPGVDSSAGDDSSTGTDSTVADTSTTEAGDDGSAQDAADGGSPDGDASASDVSTSDVTTDAMGDAMGDASDSGLCNSLTQLGNLVAEFYEGGVPVTPSGGTLADGTYVLIYSVRLTPGGATGLVKQHAVTLTINGGIMQIVENDPDASPVQETAALTILTDAGVIFYSDAGMVVTGDGAAPFNLFSLQQTCPPPDDSGSDDTHVYSSDGGAFTLVTGKSDGYEVELFAKVDGG
jgi:hypothetical protein